MRRRFRFALIAVLVGAFAWFALPGFAAESQARIVRLSSVEGRVQIDRHTGQFEKAILNMPITQGTVLRTGGDGRAEVEFENGSTIRLIPDSEITFDELSLRGSGAKVSDVVVSSGIAYFHVRHKGNDEFRVAFGNRNISVTRDAEFRVDVTNSEAKLAVFKGKLDLQGAGETVLVKKGETLSLDLTGGRYAVAQNIEPLTYDTWNNYRDQYQQEYSDSSYFNDYPYYGRDDLSYYGNYWYMPGYGNLWQPYNVGYGWNPFLNGAWCWYPGFGYTWVSTYPWGWLPYRYGRWVFIPGWGWGWMPGAYWNSWVVMPAVVNPPASFVRPTPPTAWVTSAPHPTVWVTSAPHRNDNVSVGTISGPQPTPLPAHPRSSITPSGPSTGASKTGVVTSVPAGSAPVSSAPMPSGHRQTMSAPATQMPATQSPAPASRAPAVSAPHPAPAERSAPRSAPPQSFSRPSAPPQSFVRPSAPAPVMSNPGAWHGNSSGAVHSYVGSESHGLSGRPR